MALGQGASWVPGPVWTEVPTMVEVKPRTFASPPVTALLNLLTPNVNYSGRTAPLTSKVAFYIFIQQK